MSESEAVAFDMPEVDSAFLSKQNEALKALLATKGLCRSADVPVDQMVKKVSQDVGAKLTEHVKKVRRERRKVSRRAESAIKLAVITAIDAHITSCEQAICFFKTMSQPNIVTDEVLSLHDKLQSQGLTLDEVFYIRFVKASVQDCLSWMRWTQLCGLVFIYVHSHISKDPEGLYVTQTCLMFQKLLKNVPINKDTWQHITGQ